MFVRMEKEAPQVDLSFDSAAFGAERTLTMTLSDKKSGLKKVWIGILKDGREDLDRNGQQDTGETSPLERDSDGDAYEDGIEVLFAGSDPLSPDSPPSPPVDQDGDALL